MKMTPALLATLTVLLPIAAVPACKDGPLGACTLNGCPGVKECVGGHISSCEVAEECLHPPPVRDRMQIDLTVPGEEVGVLYDRVADNSGVFKDRGVVIPGGTTNSVAESIPNVLAPALGASVIAFSRNRQPQLWPAHWTPGADLVEVQLSNNLRFNVTFWIMTGDFMTLQTNATSAVLAVNNAYVSERAGLRIGWVTINDATGNPASAALLSGGTPDKFMNTIGFSPGEINVYVILNGPSGPNSAANFTGLPMITFGSAALTFPQLLEHELGHAFVLWHVGPPQFGPENVMNPIVSAHFLTEGQIFRMHFHPSSQLNAMGLRGARPTLVCDAPGVASADCPDITRRLWADGTVPPN